MRPRSLAPGMRTGCQADDAVADDRAAGAEDRLHQRDGHAAGEDVEGEPDHHLVGAEGDDQHDEDEGEDHRRGDAAENAEPGRAGEDRADDREEGADQHLALEADIEDAGLGGERAAERDEQDRRGGADGRDDQRDVEEAV